MPIYEYVCSACGGEVEKLQKLSDAPLTDCPVCGKSALVRKISAVGFRLKGAGWYETDFKKDGRKNLSGESGDSKLDKAASDKTGSDKATSDKVSAEKTGAEKTGSASAESKSAGSSASSESKATAKPAAASESSKPGKTSGSGGSGSANAA